MGLNETPSGERLHIAFFGRRNAGKSSLVNAVTGQDLSIVSPVRGTTTDPVRKAMELLPLGPVVIIDTPGMDDEGDLGRQRVDKSRRVLNQADLAVLVVDVSLGMGDGEAELIRQFEKKEIPYLIAWNKMDVLNAQPAPEQSSEEAMPGMQEMRAVFAAGQHAGHGRAVAVSARTGQGIEELKERLAALAAAPQNEKKLASDLLPPGGLVVLVVPVDKAAPKGRLILPQQQTIRDLLDAGDCAVVCRESELEKTLARLGGDPDLVITDSQVFPLVDRLTPARVPLTSFSILFARYKGDLEQAAAGAQALKTIRDGDRILISEGCTHHRQCGDIGTVKLPAWIREYTKASPEFTFTSGTEFPEDVSGYRLIVHCGGCMLNEREMKSRLRTAADQGVPMTNYGILIAFMKGILERSMRALTPRDQGERA